MDDGASLLAEDVRFGEVGRFGNGAAVDVGNRTRVKLRRVVFEDEDGIEVDNVRYDPVDMVFVLEDVTATHTVLHGYTLFDLAGTVTIRNVSATGYGTGLSMEAEGTLDVDGFVVDSVDYLFNVRSGGTLTNVSVTNSGESSFSGTAPVTLTDATFQHFVYDYPRTSSLVVGRGGPDLPDVTLERVSFLDNADGSAVAIDGATAFRCRSCTFARNARWDGGAIDAYAVPLVDLTDSLFEDNVAGDDGGAVFLGNGASLVLTGATFRRNIADNGGALATGAVLETDTLTVTGGLFEDNEGRFGLGGGAWAHLDGTLVADGATFSGNTTLTEGGALWADHPVELTACTFDGNQADGDGGAVVLSGTTGRFVDTAFTANTSRFGVGGAIAWTDGVELVDTELGAAASENAPDDVALLGAPSGQDFAGVVTLSCGGADCR